jgi:enoyl-CoA hydratase/carnithine racemase
VADRVATITLDRPQRLNAWTGRMHTEYRSSLLRAESDPDVRVVVVTGAGRGFCAGADSGALEGHVDKGGYDPGTPADTDWRRALGRFFVFDGANLPHDGGRPAYPGR